MIETEAPEKKPGAEPEKKKGDGRVKFGHVHWSQSEK